MAQVTITGGTQWTVPDDWSNSNRVLCVGAGGGGGNNDAAVGGGGGGGGGAYAQVDNYGGWSPGDVIVITVGDGGAAEADGGDTFIGAGTIGASVCGAKGGGGGLASAAGAGGSAASSVGDTTNQGGAGGFNGVALGGHGGGSAANGNGSGSAGGTSAGEGGSGGAASEYGESLNGPGEPSSGSDGGQGGPNSMSTTWYGGAGGTSGGTAGTAGGTGEGGGGGYGTSTTATGGAGGAGGDSSQSGIYWGGGGGGGGGKAIGGASGAGAAGGLYGGGGGGGGYSSPASGGAGGVGGDGVIVITYTPAPPEEMAWPTRGHQRRPLAPVRRPLPSLSDVDPLPQPDGDHTIAPPGRRPAPLLWRRPSRNQPESLPGPPDTDPLDVVADIDPRYHRPRTRDRRGRPRLAQPETLPETPAVDGQDVIAAAKFETPRPPVRGRVWRERRAQPEGEPLPEAPETDPEDVAATLVTGRHRHGLPAKARRPDAVGRVDAPTDAEPTAEETAAAIAAGSLPLRRAFILQQPGRPNIVSPAAGDLIEALTADPDWLSEPARPPVRRRRGRPRLTDRPGEPIPDAPTSCPGTLTVRPAIISSLVDVAESPGGYTIEATAILCTCVPAGPGTLTVNRASC